ncbi:Murein L,D-transpeptidase YafK [Persephonella hydrogeniphila]|uniref:Murein L,D-transpeptidase YafK n=1 Tax=Persephonella hydrogeniphila TaxID=198703 RepID=A0A285NBJ1_9AQUI|nr:L,D-transpeptidase [Persephonella hydrogeniphila]SNZ06297.1 Murein L,D-transpeptidase YafK [Persephonella hydrogeniphila]
MRAFLLLLLLFKIAFSEEYVYSNVLMLPSHLKAIIVSKSHQKLIVVQLKEGYPVVLDEMVSITGLRFGDKIQKGDMRTPSGVYFPVSFKPGYTLPSYYGEGAFPLNYPNALDKYILRRTGTGIWIHGSEKKELLFFSSKGCVILKNGDLKKLSNYIFLKKTPVIIQERFLRLPVSEYKKYQKKVLDFLEKWKDALLKLYNGDTEVLYNLYSPHFYSKYGTRYDQLQIYKKNLYSVGGNKPFVQFVNSMAFIDKRKNGKEYFAVYTQIGFLSGDEIRTAKKVIYLSADSMKILTEENF